MFTGARPLTAVKRSRRSAGGPSACSTESPGQPPASEVDYRVTVIPLHLERDGHGTGTMSLVTTASFDQGASTLVLAVSDTTPVLWIGGEERAVELEARFGTWYYVISSASFDEVSPNREDLTKEKPVAAKPPLG